MSKKFDVLVAGEINPDLILTGENLTPQFGQVEQLVDHCTLTVGSSSVIFACGAARLGLRVAFIGVCGRDLFGRYMLEEMQTRGIDTSAVIVDEAQSTGISVILNRVSDRAILTHMGAIASLRNEQITDQMLENTRHVHIASYFIQDNLRPELPILFRRAQERGVSTSLDTNWDPSGEWKGFADLLRQVNVFLPNENEAMALTRKSSVEEALSVLARQVETVAIKCGKEGGIGAQKGIVARAATIPVEVVDTVGAGDTFDAGFIYGYLQGWELRLCLRMGAVCGSLSTQAAGGVKGQPTLDEALRYM